MPAILFVCTANRFRSPIAEACFKKELTVHRFQGDWQVSSAGTWTTDGLPATTEAINGARRLGLDIRDHKSRIVNAEMIKGADLVIVMEQGHKEALSIEFPDSAHKVRLLTVAATDRAYDIPDPASSFAAGDVPGEIDELIHTGFDRICALARKG